MELGAGVLSILLKATYSGREVGFEARCLAPKPQGLHPQTPIITRGSEVSLQTHVKSEASWLFPPKVPRVAPL